MRKTLLMLAAIPFFVACGDKNASTVEGQLGTKDYDGKYIFLQTSKDIFGNKLDILDSALVKDGQFKLNFIAEEQPQMSLVSVGKFPEARQADPKAPLAQLVLEKGAIKVEFVDDNGIPSGTALNDALAAEGKAEKEITDMYMQLDMLEDEAEMAKLQAEVEAKVEKYKASKYEMIKTNIASPLGEVLFVSSAMGLELEQINELLPLTSAEFQEKPQIKQLVQMIEAQAAASLLGKPFIDVNVTTDKGKVVKLSSLVGKGKVVLLDFWASWCKPCINEMPHLRKAYAAYKAKGFEIVGISLDQDKKAWATAVKKNEMTWIQAHDTDQSAGNAYQIQSIPFTLLIDKNGTVVAEKLRGNDIEKKLSELLK